MIKLNKRNFPRTKTEDLISRKVTTKIMNAPTREMVIATPTSVNVPMKVLAIATNKNSDTIKFDRVTKLALTSIVYTKNILALTNIVCIKKLATTKTVGENNFAPTKTVGAIKIVPNRTVCTT